MNEKNRQLLVSASGAVLVAALLVSVNVLSHYVHARVDVSEGRIYTLTKTSTQVVKRLDDPVVVTAYFSPELAPQYMMIRDYLRRLLEEYASASRGKVRFEFYAAQDPDKFRETAQKEGIVPVRFNVVEKERYEVREGYVGLVMKYQDKREVMPIIQDPRSLEFDLTGRLKKMMRPKKKVLGIVTSNGAMNLDSLPEGVHEALAESHEEKAVDLSEGPAALEGVDAVVLLGPTTRLDDTAVFTLDQALLAGKPMLLALDAKRVEMRNFMASPLDLGLDGWLRHAGLTVRKNIVLDLQSQRINVVAQQRGVQITNIVDYPPFVVSTELNADNPVVKGLPSLTFPWVSPIDISTMTGVSAVPLAFSSPRSWLRSDWERQFSRMSPFDVLAPVPEDVKGPFTLAAAVEGRFTGYFPAPPKKSVKKSTPAVSGVEPFLSESRATGRLIVVGTSRFAHRDVSLSDANSVFFLNLADWLAQDAEMSSIRSKAVAFRPLRDIAPENKALVKYADFFAGPVLVVALGLVRWRRRRDRITSRIALYKA